MLVPRLSIIFASLFSYVYVFLFSFLFVRYLSRESFDLGCFTPFNTITNRWEFVSRSTVAFLVTLSPPVPADLEFILVMGQFHKSLAIYENSQQSPMKPTDLRQGADKKRCENIRGHFHRIARRHLIYARAVSLCTYNTYTLVYEIIPCDFEFVRDIHEEKIYILSCKTYILTKSRFRGNILSLHIKIFDI